jgi:predicted DNA-binding transcriptional regulator YafY
MDTFQIYQAMNLLARPEGVDVKTLQKEMGISRSSVYRLLDHLQSDMGYPLYNERDGHRMQWKMEERYLLKLPNISLPELNLTRDDILLLSLLLGRQNPLEDTRFGKVQLSLRKKLAALDSASPGTAQSLDVWSRFVTPLRTGRKVYRGTENNLKIIFQAIENRTVCRGRYHAFSTGRELDLQFRPLRIYEWNQGLYLFCLLESELPRRNLAVERFETISLTGDTFEAPDFDPDDLMEKAFTVTWDDPLFVRIHFIKEAAPYVKARIWALDQSFEDREDGSTILCMNTSGQYDVFRWVLGFGSSARILEPIELAEKVVKELEITLQQYQSRGSKIDTGG